MLPKTKKTKRKQKNRRPVCICHESELQPPEKQSSQTMTSGVMDISYEAPTKMEEEFEEDFKPENFSSEAILTHPIQSSEAFDNNIYPDPNMIHSSQNNEDTQIPSTLLEPACQESSSDLHLSSESQDLQTEPEMIDSRDPEMTIVSKPDHTFDHPDSHQDYENGENGLVKLMGLIESVKPETDQRDEGQDDASKSSHIQNTCSDEDLKQEANSLNKEQYPANEPVIIHETDFSEHSNHQTNHFDEVDHNQKVDQMSEGKEYPNDSVAPQVDDLDEHHNQANSQTDEMQVNENTEIPDSNEYHQINGVQSDPNNKNADLDEDPNQEINPTDKMQASPNAFTPAENNEFDESSTQEKYLQQNPKQVEPEFEASLSKEADFEENKSYHDKDSFSANNYPLIGLPNLGNTCYANSVLQCLASTELLATKLQENYSKNDLFQYLDKILLGLGRGEQINAQLLNEFRSLVDCKYSSTHQHDAFEFLGVILGKISNQFPAPTYSYPTTIEVNEVRNAWNKFKKSPEKHILNNIFATIFLKVIACKGTTKRKCSFKEFSFETTFAHILPTFQLQSLEECLEDSFKKRDIGIPCLGCGGTQTYQRTKIWKAPEVFVIRLNKTGSGYSQWNGGKSQIIVPEEFAITDFLDPHMESLVPENYMLYSFIKHFGSNYSGHYVCYCWKKEVDSWVYFSDSHFKKVSEDEAYEEANSPDVMMLFYARIDTIQS